MLHDAVKNEPPSIGTPEEMRQILEHRRTLRTGFGLPVHPQDCPAQPIPIGQPPAACGEELCGMTQHGDPADIDPAKLQ
jgi:hypothetical protein